jgi:hypothetical protein
VVTFQPPFPFFLFYARIAESPPHPLPSPTRGEGESVSRCADAFLYARIAENPPHPLPSPSGGEGELALRFAQQIYVIKAGGCAVPTDCS